MWPTESHQMRRFAAAAARVAINEGSAESLNKDRVVLTLSRIHVHVYSTFKCMLVNPFDRFSIRTLLGFSKVQRFSNSRIWIIFYIITKAIFPFFFFYPRLFERYSHNSRFSQKIKLRVFIWNLFDPMNDIVWIARAINRNARICAYCMSVYKPI